MKEWRCKVHCRPKLAGSVGCSFPAAVVRNLPVNFPSLNIVEGLISERLLKGACNCYANVRNGAQTVA